MIPASVIIPVYNKSRYVADILRDLRSQTFEEFECLIVDDGSTDNSGAICDQIAAEDKRFRVIHISNSGVSHARNTALDIAKGEYITFVDADDRIAADYLKNLYSCITDNNAEFVISNFCRSFSNGERIEAENFPYNGIVNMTELLPNFVENQKKYGFYGFCWAKIFRRELIADIRFNESIVLAEDFDFYLKIYNNIRNIYFDNHKLYYYLQQAENSSQLTDDYSIDYFTQLKINLKLRDFLIKNNSYSEDNCNFLSEIIEGYVYCCIFYADMMQFDIHFDELQEVVRKSDIKLKSKRMLLWLFYRKLPLFIKLYLKTYRKMRALLK